VPNDFYLQYLEFVLLSGKFGAVIAAIPLPIIAAVYCVLFAYVGMYDSLVIDNNSDFYVGL
jgi:xanthine/uracil permease